MDLGGLLRLFLVGRVAEHVPVHLLTRYQPNFDETEAVSVPAFDSVQRREVQETYRLLLFQLAVLLPDPKNLCVQFRLGHRPLLVPHHESSLSQRLHQEG